MIQLYCADPEGNRTDKSTSKYFQIQVSMFYSLYNKIIVAYIFRLDKVI